MQRPSSHLAVALAALASVHLAVFAQASTNDDEIDNAYERCIFERKVDPENIPIETYKACLKEAGVDDPGDDARKHKGQQWRNCLIFSAVKWDDGISNVSEIAGVVVGSCSVQWREYVNAMALPPSVKQKFAGGLLFYGIDDAKRAVLFSRRELGPKPRADGR